ncbi:hypothetical protein FNH22_12910 [Fulvivirga sp. M361]|uniref:cupredoxin domain-containing protein n=1 Tax=Fulvivirga sp. M361 TaxID=2594266 RepID=UPI00117A5FB2|nr:cupredoxin domain-containing protein [Fulvivirga sp. M361]TRX58771.1 hypothetical protein FNH22_12910 [Fulvivirga sp. M361]
MKRLMTIAVFGMALLISSVSFGQKAKTVKLEQTPGEFSKTELTLKAGKPYVFDVKNAGVDHEVGFVIAPAGKTDQEHHVKSAYLSETIKDGQSATSGEVTLEKGEYVYFCPLNPTPQYKITVK